MTIRAVTTITPSGESLRMELANPYGSGIAVKKIEGISPGSADVSVMEYATADGGLFSSSRVKPRTITLTLKPLELPTVADMRHRLYRYFPLKQKVVLEFESDHRNASIEGWVQINETDIFSNDVETRIEIVCPQPYFYATQGDGVQIAGLGRIQPDFEFPFSNPVGNRNLQFGVHEISDVISADYKGDAPVGVTIEIDVLLNNESNITVARANAEHGITLQADVIKTQMRSAHGFLKGDKIRIYTMVGRKGVWLTRNNRTYHTTYALPRVVDWIQLHPGDNRFTYVSNRSDFFDVKMYAHTLYYGI